MACQVIINSWTFTRLVGAFLDLVIAYFLLCCSATAFFVSKFLALLGLSLPCPCDGLFGCRGPCVQRILVDCPAESISSIQLSVKSKFPFDSVLASNDHCRLNLKLLREGNSHDGVLELEGEASYSSFSDPRRSQHSLSCSDSFGKFDVKGKGVASQRSRSGLRRRRRASVDNGKFISASSNDHLRSNIRRSPSASSKMENIENSAPLRICGRAAPDSELNDVADESKLMHGKMLENLKNNVGCEHGVDGEDGSLVRILELALEEEQAARATLCSELEQERLAAATAADEAMAMISRLQEEKASVEIEAHQYQRILEEKSVYDAEEMDILKEIIVRRERERLILEKEVEAYRRVFQENNGLESQSNDKQEQSEVSFFDASVDPMLILQQLSDSINKRGNIKSMSNFSDCSSAYVQKQTSTVSQGKDSSSLPLEHETKIIHELESPQYSSTIPDHLPSDDEANQDIQEKGILSMDEISYPQLCESSCSQGKETVCDVVNSNDEKHLRLQVGEPHVHDVHIIDSKGSICKNFNGEDGDSLFMHDNASNVVRKCEWPFWESEYQKVDSSADNSLKLESDINRSSSDTVDQFPTASSSPDRSFASDLHRNSISAVDQERLKIDNEIGWLKARLTAVQEQKEKLKSSIENQEKGKSELQLLEDITAQLQEIRHLTAPEKAARQSSLPPLSSKVTSKKRRSRNSSIGFGQSESS
ncbi:Myosin-binding protein 2 [Bienertia sinuspersici]